jgi:phospholipid/cholesterol/gamma-HCH transport system permease protein
MKKVSSSTPAECTAERSGDRLVLTVSGRLDAGSVPDLWHVTRNALKGGGPLSVTVKGTGITYCDGAGIALLQSIQSMAVRSNVPLTVEGLKEDISRMLDLYRTDFSAPAPAVKRSAREFVEEIGSTFLSTLKGLKEHIAFLGELTVGLGRTVMQPSSLRVKDFMRIAEESGAQALPIIGMLGFLVGLILAFQGAVLMKQFAAEIFIADFVGKSVARELGPLITAIIVAGRTGSAFAAELGTMKVNEEIDALKTMGLDPVRFLVVPRVLAATLMTPMLAVLGNLFAMAGGAIVMSSIGFPLITYVNRVLAAVTPSDYLGGLAKSVVFGLLIAASGCLCGLRTGEGASAVGNSATRAVVSAIIMIVIADGIFAVLFYLLGI